MTVSNLSPRTGYVGNGATTVFSFTFPCPTVDDLVVRLVTIATLEKEFLTLDVDYSVDLEAGEVTYPLVGSPMSSSYWLELRRRSPYEQTTSYSTQGNFSPSTLEDALDYLTMLTQQVHDLIASGTNALASLATHSVSDLPSTIAAAPALIYVWDASGGGIPCFSDGTNWRRVDTRAIVS